MMSEVWPPCSTRESRSRPFWSVPNRCPALSGGSDDSDRAPSIGSGSGRTRASTTGMTTTPAQIAPIQILIGAVAGPAGGRRAAQQHLRHG